jgi:peptidoglycan/xylan/chitin deacetylase (PgdA/CDA1 family)
MLLVVNYHYISKQKFPYPGIHPLAPEGFRRQIEELGRYFQFISEEDLLSAVDGQSSLPEKACLLTFDDGLKDHYTYAAPVLSDLKIPAIFFIPGQPYAEQRALSVHRIHWLRSHTEPSVFQEMLLTGCEELGISDRIATAESGIEGKFFWDDLETKKAKYLLSVLLTDEERDQILQSMEQKMGIEREACFHHIYMTSSQVKELSGSFAVGTHSYSHTPLACKDRSEIEREIRQSMSVLSQVCESLSSISYPWGHNSAISSPVFEIARRSGLRLGFTLERSFNLTLKAPLAFARVDTNDAPGGKKPIIIPSDNGLQLKGTMKPSRTEFFRELE